MTNPITPEVRAAIERLRSYYLGPWPVEYTEPGGAMVCEQDREQVLRLALSLFPPGMPEPVEMERMYAPNTTPRWWDSPEMIAIRGLRDDVDQDAFVVRGLFVPLERVDA